MSDQQKVTVYGNAMCPYCGAARMLLTKKAIEFENIDINVENLTLVSVNGAATTTIEYSADTNNTPVVAITADGVTLGGAAQGFTISQQDADGTANSGNAGVMIDGSVVGLYTAAARPAAV